MSKIELTTAYNPGDLDPGVEYTHLQLSKFMTNLEKQSIVADLFYGSLDDEGEFVKGQREDPFRVVIEGPDWVTMAARTLGSADLEGFLDAICHQVIAQTSSLGIVV